jgi:hypothetical protein
LIDCLKKELNIEDFLLNFKEKTWTVISDTLERDRILRLHIGPSLDMGFFSTLEVDLKKNSKNN